MDVYKWPKKLCKVHVQCSSFWWIKFQQSQKSTWYLIQSTQKYRMTEMLF